ncbi:BON domain-containing protein [Roseateles cellulosilyticus]|uniref:BON domain-containing protein n=1 Tax=Pelomonas cellulosilytica TaxID=2906762 RepID=A0ABS8Y1C1_9BURK|nr:BON domain-containing protein [Pelomonas sp. P8]MCE4556738.1 BON domain-containing protein [Pelomonas sp. P8]
MNRIHTSTRRLPLIGALALAAALAACGKHEDERTAGQKLDGAITEAKQAGNEARQDAREAMDKAESKVEQAVTRTSDAVGDAAIVTKINASLAADDKLKATQIDVKADNGHVTLTGTAPDATSQQRATTLAKAVDGVHSVDNQLVVARNG